MLIDCKPDTVKKQISRILVHLREKMKKQVLGLLIIMR